MPSVADLPIFSCRPILRVEDVDASLAYYRDALGFRIGWRWSDTEHRFLEANEEGSSHTALVGTGSVQSILQNTQGKPGMWLHLDVNHADEIDILHAEWLRRGARIVEPPRNRPWGNYELRVEDLDGHTFRVAAPARIDSEDESG